MIIYTTFDTSSKSSLNTGDVYSGVGKDPSALIQALRDYLAKGGILKIGDDDVSVKTRDITDDGDCLNHPDRVAAKTCTPGETPVSNVSSFCHYLYF
jgi:hypothetical protein